MSEKTATLVEKRLVVRTSEGLRDAIFDELEALRNGESNPQRAQAVANLARQIIGTVRMEIEFQSHVASHPTLETPALSKPLKLGKGHGAAIPAR